MAVLDGELRSQEAAQREAYQPGLLDAESVEQIEIVHDVVMHVGHRRVVI